MADEYLFALAPLAVTLAAKIAQQIANPQLEDFWTKIVQWAFFTVFFSLLPIIIDFGLNFARGSGSVPSVNTVLEHGELCLISVALSSVALGEITDASKIRVAKALLIFATSVCLVAGIVIYLLIKSAANAATLPAFVDISIYAYVTTLIVTTATVAVAELKK